MHMRQPETAGFWSALHHGVIRPVSTLVLVVAATLLLAPSVLVNWTRTQIYDEERFSDSAVAALQQEAVRDALVRAIVDEIIEVGSPDAVSIRPLLEFVTATVVDSLAFQEIFRDSVEQLHAQIFGSEAGDDSVALTLVDAIIVITAYIEQAYPELANQLPPNLDTAFIEIRNRDWAVDVVAFGQNITELAIILPLAMSVLYGLALLLSQNRRQTLLYIGVAWVTVAVLLVVGRDFAREAVLSQGFADQAVSAAIWDVYTQSLLGWAMLVGGFGFALAIASTGAHRADPARHFGWVRNGVSFLPASAWGKVLRAATFVALGLLVVLQREQILELVVLLTAAYLVYYGLSELIWLAGGGTEVTATLPGRRRFAPTRRLALRAGAVVALLAASIGGVVYAYEAVETAGGENVARPSVEACNGHRQLCDRRLDEVVFLGTHNSMSAASQPGWYFAHQLTGIREQLDAGVRVLLIDTYYGFDTGRGVRTADRDFVAESLPPDQFSEQVLEAARRLAGVIGGVDAGDPRGTFLCHAFCELGATPFTQTLAMINDFLEENPGEVLILSIQDQITPEDTAKAFIASGLLKHVYSPVEGEPLPTLRELIERDQRLLVFADNNASGIDWYKQAYSFIQDTPFRVDSPGLFSCARSRGEPDAPFFAMNHWLSESFPSTASARRINTFDFIYHRVADCHREREKKVNFIIVNFFEIGDAPAVVDYLNGVAPWPAVRE
jgi:hypothetical protein